MTAAGSWWPTVIVVSAAASAAAVMVGASGPLRVGTVLWFLLVCPGMAMVCRLRLDDRAAELALAVALSVAVETILALLMVYTGVWSPGALFAVLCCGCLAAEGPETIRRLGGGRRDRRPDPDRERPTPTQRGEAR